MDNSYYQLYQLMLAGYDRVMWVPSLEGGGACPLCQRIATEINNHPGGVHLAWFLGFKEKRRQELVDGKLVDKVSEDGVPEIDFEKEVEIYKNAPIYNWAHVGCECSIKVYKSTDASDSFFVTREG